jgi:alpha-glucosidase
MLGVVWPDKHVAFPDFLDPTNATNNWWSNEIRLFHDTVDYCYRCYHDICQLQLAFDGIWIDMNEPSAFGTNEDHPWYYDNDDHPNIPPLFCLLSGADSTLDVPPYATQAAYYYDNVVFWQLYVNFWFSILLQGIFIDKHIVHVGKDGARQ